MPISGHHFIAGDPSAEGHQTFTSVNPRTKTPGDVQFFNATPSEIDHAVTAAAEAFKITRHYSASRLAEFLERVAVEIEALGDEWLNAADMETGLGLTRLTGERARTTGQLRAFANLLREGSYVEAIIDTAVTDRPDIRRMLFPIGPVAVFAASNFPFAFSVAGGDTASAFAAGCPVIVKAHSGHPATSELTALAINRAIIASNFPSGFFSLLQGDTVEVGQNLVKHPLLEAVGFTGSLRAGRAIFDTASARPKPIPVYAEMGSINPIVILPGALTTRMETLADGLVTSVTLGTGQFCTNPGLVLVIDSPETSQFVELVRSKMEARPPGVLLNASIERGLIKAVASTGNHSAVQTLTGAIPKEAESFCYPNTVLATRSRAFVADPALQTEHFGPVTLFVICEDMADLQSTLPAIHGNLTATIHAEENELGSAKEVFDLLREKAGRLILNGFPTGVAVVHSMQHGGPYPATSAPATTSVGMTSIKRFLRPVAFQNLPDVLLPEALQNANPLNIWRIVDNKQTKGPIVKS
ncbi:MAG: aldehyde dehydrogenase (NADP(+)) [Chloroflexi bacterium]|nr:aldehyde dehydrogenase (NADP(+)) [Chloroflexota bacterium]